MKVGVAKETAPGERRVALVPEALGKLQAAGLEILVESGAGAGRPFPTAPTRTPARPSSRPTRLYAAVGRRPPGPEAVSAAEVARLRTGQARRRASSSRSSTRPLAKALADAGRDRDQPRRHPAHAVRAPRRWTPSARRRTSAATRPSSSPPTPIRRYFPLLTTAAGTAKPANVLILGIGVAGLQAIGTAKRLGAVVHAYDVRPETARAGREPGREVREAQDRRSTRPAPAATPAS